MALIMAVSCADPSDPGATELKAQATRHTHTMPNGAEMDREEEEDDDSEEESLEEEERLKDVEDLGGNAANDDAAQHGATQSLVLLLADRRKVRGWGPTTSCCESPRPVDDACQCESQ